MENTAISKSRLVLIVGPSGAGKDTLIDYAKGRLQHESRIHFVRRVITRPASVGEDHEPVSAAVFDQYVEGGAFALHWEAHGLQYGLPGIVDHWLAQGHVVVANGSRAILPMARHRYTGLQIVHITASQSVLQERLERRGREEHESRKARMARSDTICVGLDDALAIDNSGDPGSAGDQLVEALLNALPQASCR